MKPRKFVAFMLFFAILSGMTPLGVLDVPDSYGLDALAADGGGLNFSNLDDWYIFDHHDPEAAFTSTAKKKNYPYAEAYASGTSLTTIKDLLGSNNNTDALKTVHRLKEHIYVSSGSQSTSMTFAGYGAPAYKDFMFYPFHQNTTKAIYFDVDTSKVESHTLRGTGFFLNVGIDDNGKLVGAFIYLQYIYPSNQVQNVALYKLKPTNPDVIHEEPTEALIHSSYAELLCTFSGYPIADKTKWYIQYSDTHVNINVTDLTVPNAAPKQLTASTATLDIHTGYYGFGPYVDYNYHGCPLGTIVQFNNVKMYTSDPLAAENKISEYRVYNIRTSPDDPVAFIDLLTEQIHIDRPYTIGAHSKKGGKKWYSYTPVEKDGTIGKFLNRGGILVLAEDYDYKERAPIGRVITFPKIEKRPKKLKMIPNYLALHLDADGNINFQSDTQNYWTITRKNSNVIPTDRFLVKCLSLTNAKHGTVTRRNKLGTDWFLFPEEGIQVSPIGEDGKATKGTYLLIPEPSVATANSKPMEVVDPNAETTPSPSPSPSSTEEPTEPEEIKTLNIPMAQVTILRLSSEIPPKFLKVDYKKEVLKKPKNYMLDFGMETVLDENQAPVEQAALYRNPNAEKINIEPYISNKVFQYRLMPTQKKPSSPVVQYTMLDRQAITPSALTVTSGNISAAGFEFCVGEADKWRKTAKIGSVPDLAVKGRLKATGKPQKEFTETTPAYTIVDDMGLAASLSANVSYTIGMVKNKPTVVSAAFT